VLAETLEAVEGKNATLVSFLVLSLSQQGQDDQQLTEQMAWFIDV